MSKIAIIKIHPGLNMALPQLSGDLVSAGHETKLFFFKDYEIVDEHFSNLYGPDSGERIDPLDDEYGEEYKKLAIALRSFGPDALGLSVITLSIEEAIKTTRFLRERFDLPILWGGVGTTLEPEIAIEYADLVCVGEGEEVFTEFADCLDNGSDWRHIDGTWTHADDGSIIKNPKRKVGSLDDISIPDWDPDKMHYITGNKTREGIFAFKLVTDGDYQIMTQRGCPFSCSFCVESRYQEMFGKKGSLRRRSPEIVIEELVAAKEKFDLQSIWFWDDVFTVNPRWLRKFLPMYKEQVGIPFWCYTYPTTHDLQLMKDLKEAGCTAITMGIQSGSERILRDVYNRPTPLDRVIEASQEIVDSGLVGYFDLISKSVFETEDDLRATYEFLVDLPQEMNYAGIAEMKSYPTYSYTNQEVAAQSDDNIVTTISTVSDELYDYYHNLYWVARNPFIDKDEKLRIGREPAFRDNPELLAKYFYSHLDIHDHIKQIRKAVATGKQPYELFPLPEYVHEPLAQFQKAIES